MYALHKGLSEVRPLWPATALCTFSRVPASAAPAPALECYSDDVGRCPVDLQFGDHRERGREVGQQASVAGGQDLPVLQVSDGSFDAGAFGGDELVELAGVHAERV